LIPRYLFEQIKGRDWEVENIYKFGPLFVSNPLNRVWVLLKNNTIKGVLWITIDPVVEIIAVNVLSVDREYQRLNGSLRSNPSGIFKRVIDFLHD
jgi:ABC-type nitrate/sulfonate/bicarbonate transport system permease component